MYVLKIFYKIFFLTIRKITSNSHTAMGSIISRLRGGSSQPSNKTIAKLASLQTDIQTLEKKRNQVKTSQQLLLRRIHSVKNYIKCQKFIGSNFCNKYKTV